MPELAIRRLESSDRPAVLQLLQATMGWLPDEQHAAFFAWKHDQNPFGPSLGWVMVDGERVVGLRIFMRWEFLRDGEIIRAVRAVDTATHPDYQGRGIFSRLTLHALDELRAEGVAFVFNTPNKQSRPGYLKMGWQEVGRLPVLIRPRSLRSLPALASTRRPASRFSLPTSAGIPAAEVLAEGSSVTELLARSDHRHGLTTHRSIEHLRWRYGLPIIAYRARLMGTSIREGLALFRLRNRGRAIEATVTDLLGTDDDDTRIRALLRLLLDESGADYCVRLGARGASSFLPIPRYGPVLVWRSVVDKRMAPLQAWRLSLGDIELF